jgi:hypothetical protein
MAGFAGLELDASDQEILEAARRVATELLPKSAGGSRPHQSA